jgi:hypothetical protein
LLAVASKNATAVKAAIGYVALSGVAELATKDFSGSKPFSNIGGYSGIPLQKAENKAIKDAVTYRKQENAALKAKTAVDQLKDKFDLERIGLTAALNAATDEETKLRLRSQLAILDNNEALAKKLLAEMNGAKAADELAKALVIVAGAAMDSAAKFKQINPFAGTLQGETGRDPMPVVIKSPVAGDALDSASKFTQTNPLAGTYYGETGRDMPSYLATSNLTVNIDASNMIDSDRMVDVVQNAFLTIQRQGGSTVPAGAY